LPPQLPSLNNNPLQRRPHKQLLRPPRNPYPLKHPRQQTNSSLKTAATCTSNSRKSSVPKTASEGDTINLGSMKISKSVMSLSPKPAQKLLAPFLISKKAGMIGARANSTCSSNIYWLANERMRLRGSKGKERR